MSFFICWSPFHAQRVLANYTTQASPQFMIRTLMTLTHISGVTYYLTTSINPLLYQLMSYKFRIAFRETFGFWFPFLRPAKLQELSYYKNTGKIDNSFSFGKRSLKCTNGSLHHTTSSVSSCTRKDIYSVADDDEEVNAHH